MAEAEQEYPSLKEVQAAFKKVVKVPPYCAGTVPLNASQSLLFYRTKDSEEARFIDFANPTESQLKALADACSPASFGRNQEDVLDENYRKAGKMDAADFSLQFSPWGSGILKTIVSSLFRDKDRTTEDMVVELYKLNVYGPGSFFKAHVDTPRSDTMFGSLVLVLPTPHSGGSLVFRHKRAEYTFDSASAVSESTNNAPHAAFAAFFSDIKHEVAEVTSGYRVTLTYNLYHTTTTTDISDAVTLKEVQDVEAIKTVVESFVSNPNFLPVGGLLAFGLSYEYPFSYDSTVLANMTNRLKGIDALLLKMCKSLKLQASLKAVYFQESPTGYCFVDETVLFPEYQIEEGIFRYLCEVDESAIVGFEDPDETNHQSDYYTYEDRVVELVWAKPLDDRNTFEGQYVSYGNEASLDCAYGQLCLVVHIKPALEREDMS